jgi:uncharacterized LabA/DUF88 family protein
MPGKHNLREFHGGFFMSRSCVFVDGGYFQKVLERDFERPRVDFARLGPVLAGAYEPLLRLYYYNCPPYQSASATPQERELVRKADRFYYALRNLPNLQLRLGRLAFRGISRETGEPIFEQKRVDIQLAVDLLTLSYSRQIATAVIVAGDSDFIPVFQAAKDQAVRIVLYHGRNNPAHRDLVVAADQAIVFDKDLIDNVRRT